MGGAVAHSPTLAHLPAYLCCCCCHCRSQEGADRARVRPGGGRCSVLHRRPGQGAAQQGHHRQVRECCVRMCACVRQGRAGGASAGGGLSVCVRVCGARVCAFGGEGRWLGGEGALSLRSERSHTRIPTPRIPHPHHASTPWLAGLASTRWRGACLDSSTCCWRRRGCLTTLSRCGACVCGGGVVGGGGGGEGRGVRDGGDGGGSTGGQPAFELGGTRLSGFLLPGSPVLCAAGRQARPCPRPPCGSLDCLG